MRNIRKKTILRTVLIMVIAAMVLVCCAVLYIRAVKDTLRQETRDTLLEVAGQNAAYVRRQIDGDLMMLRTAALFIGEMPEFDMDEYMRLLNLENSRNPFKRMGLIMPDGTTYATDDVAMDLSGREYFSRAMAGESVISESLTDVIDGTEIFVYATPVHRGGQIVAVLFATVDASVFADSIQADLFDGEGYSYLADRNGKILLAPDNPGRVVGLENIFIELESKKEAPTERIAQMRSDIRVGTSGLIEYCRDGVRRYLCYNPIGMNGWYVLSVVSEHVVAEKSVRLGVTTLWTCVGVVVVFIGLFGYMLFIQRRSKHELLRLAYRDGVTGGSNWNGFVRDARMLLENSPPERYVVVSCDIDKFKVFNDLFGHSEGNQVLHYIWGTLRETLGADEPFARVSADNFCILMKRDDDELVVRRLEDLQTSINMRGENTAPRYLLTLSFGVYRIPAGEYDLSMMNDRAGIARKRNKGSLDGKIAFYNHLERERGLLEKEIENEMIPALENGEFEVYLQPKYSAKNARLVGAEALIRWNRPQHGLLPPDMFIPLFEHNGFITQLDGFVLEQVCRTLQRWAQEGRELIPISVNLSRRNIGNPGLAETITDTVKWYEISPSLIELELTENGVIDFQNIERLVGIMQALQKEGFLLSMDDFGSGFSSLNLLRRLPFDVVKLDRAFFAEDFDTLRGRTVVADVAEMARHLKMTVVAEGVETREQVEFLTSIGCDVIQGYYFARPMPIGEFEKLNGLAPIAP